ncbi:MAG: tRNA guanosine(34) transglycosylase Tgt [Candidatus Porifericomitaceae bacterium WSBS_2022_MAG_OTU9]
MFQLITTDGDARRGRLSLPHGVVETPVFMPVGTYATVKAMATEELVQAGSQIILANAFHLAIRPGVDIIEQHGSLHDFMAWPRPILTDSGGYQVFSLKQKMKITAEGVHYQSPIDGQKLFISPQVSMQNQRRIGADIIMALDHCPASTQNKKQVAEATERSMCWAKTCRQEHEDKQSILFGINQGGIYQDLRQESMQQLMDMGFQGYAIGGLSVGESHEQMMATIASTTKHMPRQAPRYLMGVGTPKDIVAAVNRGIDMFDCVLPSRNARNGQFFTSEGTIKIKNQQYKIDQRKPDPKCKCWTCRHTTRAYLHHLHKCNEIQASRLTTIHNINYYHHITRQLRKAIESNTLTAFTSNFMASPAATT